MGTRTMPFIGSLRDLKRHWKALSIALIFVACSPANFEKSPPTGSASNPPGPTGETPCSPMGGYFPSNQNGMYGWLIVQTPSVCQSNQQNCNSHSEMTNTADGAQGDKLSDMVVAGPLSPTRDFSVGFSTRNGGQLTYRGTNTPVVEYWGFNMRTKIALANGEPEGDYQFLALVDDGFALVYEPAGGTPVPFLNLENVNSTSVVTNADPNAGPHYIHLRPGDRIPFRILYYQTPATEIAFFMMWRRVTASTPLSNDPLNRCANGVCGRNTFWNVDGGGAPTSRYNELIARGWQPMRPENFWMPDNLVHTCQ